MVQVLSLFVPWHVETLNCRMGMLGPAKRYKGIILYTTLVHKPASAQGLFLAVMMACF